jgi:streptogramin lyase
MRRIGSIAAVAGCLLQIGVLTVLGAAPAGATPLGKVEEFARPPGSLVSSIAAGPGGNLWFTDRGGVRAIGEIAPSGQIVDEFSAGLNAGSQPVDIAAGPDGNMWFTESGASPAIGRITPSGEIKEYKAGLDPGIPIDIAAGPDGDMWFTEIGGTPEIGRITPSGEITEFTAGLNAGSAPGDITAGPDGNVWFIDRGDISAIGRVTPSGTIAEFEDEFPYLEPSDITAGPDGNLWFTAAGENGGEEFVNYVVRVTPAGHFTNYKVQDVPHGIAVGAEGSLWFTATGYEPGIPSAIGRITTSGAVSEFSAGFNTGSEPADITAGPDGNMWFTDEGTTKAIGLFGLGTPAASQSPPVVSGAGQVGDQLSCEGASWSLWAGRLPSASAFAFDGYQWLLDGRVLAGATAQSYTPTAAEVGHQLTCSVTVTYPLLDVTVSAASAGVTVSPAPVVNVPPAPAPTPTPKPPLPSVSSTMTWTFGWTRHYTIVESLTAHGVPKGGYVEVACKGHGCPFASHRSATVASANKHCHGHKCHVKRPPPQGPNVSLAGLFKGRHLSVGASISVSILKSGWVGKSFVFTMRKNQTPGVQIACLAPGSASHPGRGC